MAEKKESLYTDAIIAKMKAIAPLDWESAQAFAEENGLKARGVVASAKRNGIAYKRKEKVTKAGTPVVSKSDLVEAISAKYDIDLADLDGLDKATKSALEALVG